MGFARALGDNVLTEKRTVEVHLSLCNSGRSGLVLTGCVSAKLAKFHWQANVLFFQTHERRAKARPKVAETASIAC